MSDFRPQVKRNALSNSKIRITATNSIGKAASMQFKLKKNNPQIQVYTNDPNDTENYGRIDAALDSPTFNAYIVLLRRAAQESDFKKVPIQNFGYTFPNGRRSDQTQLLSTLMVGRDEDGSVWTAVTAKNRPMIKFYFLPSDYHRIMDSTGEQMARGPLTQIYALAFADLIQSIMNNLQVIEYEEPPQKQNGNGGGGGGGNRGGYNRGGSGNSGGSSGSSGGNSGGFEDDIPF